MIHVRKQCLLALDVKYRTLFHGFAHDRIDVRLAAAELQNLLIGKVNAMAEYLTFRKIRQMQSLHFLHLIGIQHEPVLQP